MAEQFEKNEKES